MEISEGTLSSLLEIEEVTRSSAGSRLGSDFEPILTLSCRHVVLAGYIILAGTLARLLV